MPAASRRRCQRKGCGRGGHNPFYMQPPRLQVASPVIE
ncbi:Uncharacterised protein [Bordetella pertussis]|nr:Uncharacterised protein [Bordetella pertussis]